MSNLEQFGKYILLEKLAVGGMAEVYLAKQSGANGVSKFVAVKRILPQFSDKEDFIDMFKEEASITINLNHSNIVSIYDFGIEKGQFYLVMEFVEGRNLRQILNELKKANKSISIEQAVYIVKEATAGLDHAHRCTDSKSGKPLNITHRDMSPQNIMISFEGESKVIDFGIAKVEKETDGTKAGTLKGKFAYMSPEQSEGLPIDPRTDVFALGIILWELLANDRLFTGSNEAAILRKVRDCQIPPIRKINPLVPPELERIVTKALAKDKNVRYQTAANLQKDLNRFLNMHAPDFSSQDFSTFIKECFKTAYTEGREKLVQYGKVQSVTDAKALADTHVPETQAGGSNNKNELPPIPQNLEEQVAKELQQHSLINLSPEQKNAPEVQKVKITLDGIRAANVAKTPVNKSGPMPLYNEVGQSTRVTQMTQLTQTNRNRKYNKPSPDSNDVIAKFFLVAVLCFLSFWGYKNYLKPSSEKQLMASAKTKKTKEPNTRDEGKIEISSIAKVMVSLSSQPAGANIYIDGKDTGETTPSIISVIANKELTIALAKDGYAKYETTKHFEQTSSFTATLQPQVSGGYINIYVVNGGAKPAIFVNGQRLTEELPIKKYRVTANTEVTVFAENAITRLQDEVKLKVAADQVLDVELILGRKQNNEKK